MKVFVSSTCYDLLDLRAELHRDLRDLGVKACFSDLKESDFETCGQSGQNSIETCLANVCDSDIVILILSQRYGPSLGENYKNLSATHVEYKTAVEAGKTIHFYIRDRLVGDWSGWKQHKRPADYPSSWAVPGHDANGLFSLIHEHQRLKGGGDIPGANNWFWQFTSSVDLRADIRKRIGDEAFLDTGRKMAEKGQAPILVVVGQVTNNFEDVNQGWITRFSLNLANAGTQPALSVCGQIHIENIAEYAPDGAKIGLVVPGDDPASRVARTVNIDIPKKSLDDVFANDHEKRTQLPVWFIASYTTPSGHSMEDRTLLMIEQRDGAISLCASSAYYSKRVTGMTHLVG